VGATSSAESRGRHSGQAASGREKDVVVARMPFRLSESSNPARALGAPCGHVARRVVCLSEAVPFESGRVCRTRHDSSTG